MRLRRVRHLLAITALLAPVPATVQAAGAITIPVKTQQVPPDLLSVSYLAHQPDTGHIRFIRGSTDGSLLFVGRSDGSLARSGDGGRTWKALPFGVAGAPGAQLLDVQVAPSDKRIVWAAGLTGVYRSTDAGLTWSERDVRSDVPGRALGSVLAINPRHPESAYLAGYRFGGLYRTSDGGLSWQQVMSYPVSAVAVEPANGAIVYAISRTAGFQRSEDHGHTWSAGVQFPSYAGIGEESAAAGRFLAIDGPKGGLFASLDGGGLMRSQDGGRTWKDYSNGLPKSVAGNGYAVPYDLSATTGPNARLFAIAPSGILGAGSGGFLFSMSLATTSLSSTVGISLTMPFSPTPALTATAPINVTPPISPTSPISWTATVTGASPVAGTTPTVGATPTASQSPPVWQPWGTEVDAVATMRLAPSHILVGAESGSIAGYPAIVGYLGGSRLYGEPYLLPPPIARATASGFSYGSTQEKYVSGVNYEGPADRPWRLWQDGKFDPELVARDFDGAAAAGYRVVRVFVQDPLPAQALASQFGHLDTLVTLARQRDLRLLITFNDSRDPALSRVASVDQAIAAHLRGNPTIFGYDLQNEPGFQDIAGAIYPPGVTIPLLADALIKRYGEPVKLQGIHKARAAGKWRDGIFAHMSERQVYQYLNAATILDDYLSAGSSATVQPLGGRWGPLLSAVNASLSIYLRTQMDAVRSVDQAHVITVGYNNAFWAGLAANDILNFRSIHLYPTSKSFASIHNSLQLFENLLSSGRTPLVLEEYGFSTAFQSGATASVQETGMSLYLRVLGGSGDFKWQLNDDTVGYNAVENGLGLFGAHNAPKVGFYVSRELASYFGGPHRPGGVRISTDASTGLRYLYSAADALGVSGGSYTDPRVTYTAHNKAPSAQLWLDWAQPGRLRFVSTHQADLSVDLSALTGALSGTITLAPTQSFAVTGSRVRLRMQAGIWYTITYQPGGKALILDDLPAPARADGWYILAAGHNVSPPFLTRWLNLGGVPLLGAPMEEARRTANGVVQYFGSVAMRARGTTVGLLPLGLAELGGSADPPAKEMPNAKSHQYFASTGHNLHGSFLQFWRGTGGLGFWGPPVTEERQQGRLTVQYFANAEFVWDGSNVSLGPLGARAWARLNK